jgi:hypothetical protein
MRPQEIDYHPVKLFLINNPSIRKMEELEKLIGYSQTTIRNVMKELNIQISTRPAHCKG